MQIYVERGASKGDCLEKITKKYGIRFTILREKTYRPSGLAGLFAREGVEVEFCLPSFQRPLPLPPSGGGAEYSPGYTRSSSAVPAAAPATMSSDDYTLDFEEEKKRILTAAGRDPEQVLQQVREKEIDQQAILDKLKEIQSSIETGKEAKPEHPHLVRIAEMLRLNDFSDRYTTEMMERARTEMPLGILEDFDAAQDRILVWIGESIKIFTAPEKPAPRILVLIGPTGVGKTTTVAKLAAIYGIENASQPVAGRKHPLSVRMITIDAFRIGAKKQLEDYGDIMEIPVSYIDNHRDLRREIDLYREETDLILIDTIGRSPKDSVKLGEMKELLDACGPKAEIHLVLSASTKTSDIEHILQQFEPFNYRAVMLTKLDETRHIGNVISALAEREKPISYITDGQIVPKDIKKASVVRFLINLEEFRVDREKIERQFPATLAEQFQWG